ncbi:hypothetical protein [Paractinoplanes brasiliensis]|uniref:Uncharacterized protein n=1 Tax=Paractinoplanes brasiliensis TaxID=52695 RepID=A0A4R6JVU3_9ACTN|nr:hypothetical protein [Actinoplanes brasiliensis]TDO40367.1 hypothetical protein C8E87_4081 [Actinoplanes brasiliensis]GID25433.1 hypothetical protein Abr02nite_04160 [Actinoplanes brasiliensis]
MSNLTRIIGGVVVAGALAAGASAFTASGVATDTPLSGGIVGGGAVEVQVNELAKVMAASLIQSTTDPNRFTGVMLNVKATDGTADLPTGSTVKAKLTGTGGDATAAWEDCTESTTTTGKFTCEIAASKYFESVTKVEIAVFGPTA